MRHPGDALDGGVQGKAVRVLASLTLNPCSRVNSSSPEWSYIPPSSLTRSVQTDTSLASTPPVNQEEHREGSALTSISGTTIVIPHDIATIPAQQQTVRLQEVALGGGVQSQCGAVGSWNQLPSQLVR
ncbi:hypothetical protein MSAN_01802700 [Mycena sanguinolenta]|uniref:Uncharacterized protein n=1 Tax=Mycena sanguinolenta TaxID=230812 RepID=A0A8H6XSZ4_9AGAR|nr:hypothetical protein MSAN_01802700 [Mycena sanguinolenta]